MTREEFEKSIGWPWIIAEPCAIVNGIYSTVTHNLVVGMGTKEENEAILSAMKFYLDHFDEARKEVRK